MGTADDTRQSRNRYGSVQTILDNPGTGIGTADDTRQLRNGYGSMQTIPDNPRAGMGVYRRY